MIKWIGQHIVDLIARFRDDVYLENLAETTQDHVVSIDANGKLYKQDKSSGDITSVVGGLNIGVTGGTSGDATVNLDTNLADMQIIQGSNVGGGETATQEPTVTLRSFKTLHLEFDADDTDTDGTLEFLANGASVGSMDQSGNLVLRGTIKSQDGSGATLIPSKGSAGNLLVDDAGQIKSRTVADLKGDLSLAKADVGLGSAENKSSATIRGEIVDGNIPALATSKITSGTFDDARIPSLAASKVTSGTFDAARIPTLNQDTSGTATNATKQVVVSHHHFFMNSSSTTADFFFPYNNLNEASSVSQYYTRTIAPYAGRIVKVLIRPSAAIGTACKLQFHKITDTTLNFGTAVEEVTSINLNTAETSVSTAFSSATFSAGDVVNVSLIKSSTATANIQAVIVWEYTT